MSATAYTPELHHPEPATLPPAGSGGSDGSDGTPLSADYGGAVPPFTPTEDGVHAIDTSTGQIWWYYNGQWQ